METQCSFDPLFWFDIGIFCASSSSLARPSFPFFLFFGFVMTLFFSMYLDPSPFRYVHVWCCSSGSEGRDTSHLRKQAHVLRT